MADHPDLVRDLLAKEMQRRERKRRKEAGPDQAELALGAEDAEDESTAVEPDA